MPPVQIAQRVVDNPIVTLGARVAMFLTPLIFSAVLWVGGNYLAGQTSAMAAVTTRVGQVETFDGRIDTRVTTLETQARLGREDRLAFQDQTTRTLAKLLDQNTELAKLAAALTARLDEADRAATRK